MRNPEPADWFDIAETSFGSDETGGPETVTCAVRHVGEDGGIDEPAAPIWSHYGLAYRPPAPDGADVCQALCQTIGGKRSVTATRDLRAADVHGALNEGDVALWSVGKNMLRLNANGGVSLLLRGDTDASIGIEPDGAILFANRWGSMSLDGDGFKVVTADGGALVLNSKVFQALAQLGDLEVGALKTHAAASAPLTPTSAAPNVLV